MHRTKRKLIAAGMLATACWMPVMSAANMQAALDGMYSTITNPSAYQSQNRMGAVGGSLSLRVPNQRVNLMTLDMPRIDMGCGAIDMFGGSFSFINADALIAIMRNIGQIAVASLFKLAICSVSEKVCQNISEFTKLMHDLNNMKMNSCKVGAAIAGKVADTIGLGSAKNQTADNKADVLKAATGKDSEGWGTWWKKLSQTIDSKNAPPEDTSIAESGNSVWRALWHSEAHKSVTMGDGKDALVATLIMNIGGTEILPTSKACQEKPNAEACKRFQNKVAAGQITVDRLINPSDLTVATFEETEGGSLSEFSFIHVREGRTPLSQLLNTTTSSSGPAGFRALALRILFGTAVDSLSADDIANGTRVEADGGIVHYIKEGNWGTFNATYWLDRVSTPVLRHLVLVQRSEGAMSNVANQFANVIAEDMAVQFATALGDAAAQAFTGKAAGIVSKPSDYDENVQIYRKSVNEYRARMVDATEKQKKMQEFVESVAKTLSNPGVAALAVRK